MAMQNYTLNIGKTSNLDAFDDVTHIAFGGDSIDPQESQSTLNLELYRIEVLTATKDTINKTYTFTGRIPLFYLNSVNVYEIGLFNAVSGGDMAGVLVLDNVLNKTSDDELFVTILVKTDLVNV